jgi:carbonic anhydrase
MAMTRREALIGFAGLGGGAAATIAALRLPGGVEPAVFADEPHADKALTADEALQKLLAGNKRFVDGKLTHPNTSVARREEVAPAQHPYAIILGCSDSRVAPEYVFDAGLGDLFVVRAAGQVADDPALGSIEYAAEHLHVPLVVVLGHKNCGAVRAAVGTVTKDEAAPGHLLSLVDAIAPAVAEVKDQGGDVIDNSVRANVRHTVRKLEATAPVLRPMARKGTIKIVGAYYDIQSGRVEVIPIK